MIMRSVGGYADHLLVSHKTIYHSPNICINLKKLVLSRVDHEDLVSWAGQLPSLLIPYFLRTKLFYFTQKSAAEPIRSPYRRLT